ncbi:MAG: hypothetical protein WB507_01815 [Solirubrobacterales bacterium]
MAEATLDDVALRSLAQFRPFEDRAERMEAVHAELVQAACQTHDGGFPSIGECQAFIRTTWKTELESHEVAAARGFLEARGRVEKDSTGLRLTDVARCDLEAQREGWEQAEVTALEEWEMAVRKEYPFLENDDVLALRSQLRPWLDQVIACHGAEASLLLYPGHERRGVLEKAMAETDLSFLPNCRPEVDDIRAAAFRMLVRQPTPAQREFLGRLLNTGFYLTVLSVDPRASHLFRKEAKKTTLYLDTNFLYALLGVGSSTEGFSAKRLMQLCRDLGFSLRVTPWTIEELATSIAKSKADIMNVHQSRKAAEVMAEVSGEKGFAAAYWRQRRDTKIDPTTFFGKFEQFRLFLEELGIKEHPEGCAEVDADIEAVRRHASPLEGMYGPGKKPRLVIEHDAKMRILISRLRGSNEWGGFSDVEYWFLTESTNLPTYARVRIDESSRPRHPFCILSSTWAQIVRVLVPRTDDLNDMIVGLLASPYVGYKPPFQGDRLDAVEKTVSRIDALRDVPASVAVAMVKDEAMSSQIAGQTDPEEISRLVEQSLTKKAEELEARIAETAKETVRANRERREAEERAREADKRETAHLEGRVSAEQDADHAKQDAIEAERAKDEVLRNEANLKQQIEETEAREKAEKAARTSAEGRVQMLRITLGVVAGVGVLAAACALLLAEAVTGTPMVLGLIGVTAALIYVILRVFSAGLAKEVAVGITVVGVVVAIGAALIANDPGHKPASGSGGSHAAKPR